MTNVLEGFANQGEYAAWLNKLNPNIKSVVMAMRAGVVNITNNIGNLVEELLPVALPVLGIAIAVFFGVKFIKKVMR